jgi:hypothetical protein
MKANNTPELKKAEWLQKWAEAKELNEGTPNPALEQFVDSMFATAPDSFWALNAKHNADFERYIFESGKCDDIIGEWVF